MKLAFEFTEMEDLRSRDVVSLKSCEEDIFLNKAQLDKITSYEPFVHYFYTFAFYFCFFVLFIFNCFLFMFEVFLIKNFKSLFTHVFNFTKIF